MYGFPSLLIRNIRAVEESEKLPARTSEPKLIRATACLLMSVFTQPDGQFYSACQLYGFPATCWIRIVPVGENLIEIVMSGIRVALESCFGYDATTRGGQR